LLRLQAFFYHSCLFRADWLHAIALLELERAIAVAEKANQVKSDFLSSMSHELRTPLHAILGFGQLIENGSPPLTPDQKGNVHQILKAGWHLLELVNQVLDLATIEGGKQLISLELISLTDVMRECEAMMSLMAQERGISLVFPVHEIAYFVQADRILIKQVLINCNRPTAPPMNRN
jgi:signal transduction histidine kinase